MYNRNKKTVLNSVHLPPLKVYQKCSMMSIRSRRFDLLPVIQEEEGNNMDEVELNNFLFEPNPLSRKPSFKKLYNNPKKSEENVRIRSNMKLPPLANINCMMNMDLKHSQSIWDTNFSKKLINGRNIKDNVKSPRANEKNSASARMANKKSFGDYSLPNDKLGQDRSIGDSSGGSLSTHKQKIATKKKRPKAVKPKKNTLKEDKVKSVSTTTVEKVSESKTTLSSNTKQSSNQTDTQSETFDKAPPFSNKQHFLAECVKSILECEEERVICERCNEAFLDFDELTEHNKKHEDDKQECLLCGEIFFSGNEFVQHLLSHEGVDKFSCKKCKKYFPSLKTYRVHCQKIHLIPSDYSQSLDQRVKHSKECLLKYECVRCDSKYSTEEGLEAHKKVHAKQDMIGAYSLKSQGIVL